MSNRLFNDDEFNSMFRATEKNVNRAFGVILVFWVLGVLLSLGVTGVFIWAVIKLISHFCP